MRKKNAKPLVSVIMPVYNAGSFLHEAIGSILSQTYRNFELIVIDDASTDNSWKIISQYKKQYPRKIKAIRLKRNLNKGGDAAGNVGIELAKGEFIARMDADDISVPIRLEKQVKYMQENPKCSVLGSNAYVIDRNGRPVGEKKVPLEHDKIYDEYFVFHPMIHPSVMIRRSSLVNLGTLYDLPLDANNDYLTFFKMISGGYRFANLEDKLVHYRIHGKNDSLTHTKKKFVNSLKIRFLAVTKFGYRPSFKGVVKLFGQALLVLSLPERVIVPLYLLMRGISKPSFGLSRFPLFAKLREAKASL